MKAAIFLLGAIIFEVIGTTMLNLSDGFTNILPTVIMFICFALSFVCLIGALKTIPLSIAYSVWAGLGTAGAAIIGIFLFQEQDRKSTRLNSSHVSISYAVFCLKK